MRRQEWGITGIFSQYAPSDLINDLWFPIIAGGVAAWLQSKNEDLLYQNLCKLIDYAIVYLPVMATIILTAYTMMISALKSAFDVDKLLKQIQDKNKGGMSSNPKVPDNLTERYEQVSNNALELRNSISASFAANIIITVYSIGMCLGIYLIIGIGEEFKYADTINYIVFAMVVAMILYPIRTMIGIVSDMFSISKIA